MPTALSLRQGRYAILEAELEGGPTPLGILLEDPGANQLYVRLRRDWQSIAPDDPVLPLLEQDLEAKGADPETGGAAGLFQWLEENCSANLRTTDRQTVAVDQFERTLNRLYAKHIHTSLAQVPRYSLRSAAGKFLDNSEVEEEGREELPRDMRFREGMFAAHIVGTSMEPVIPDGSVAVFEPYGGGTRQNRLVLVEESGSRYTLKKYSSRKEADGDSWHHGEITLQPLNDEHEPIHLTADDTRYRVVAWFVDVLY